MLGYFGMPDPARWAVPTDLNRLLGIIKLARTLGVNPIIEHLSSALEIAPDSLKLLKTGVLRKKMRDKSRCVHLLCFKSILIRSSTCVIHHRECLNSASYYFIPGPPCSYFLFVFTVIHRSGRAAFCVLL